MSTYFDRLESQLVERCTSGAHLRRRRRLRVPRFRGNGGILVVVSGVAVAVLVVLVAVSVSRGPSNTKGAAVAGSPRGVSGLIAELGVLRRSQTAADRRANGVAAGPLRAPGLGSVVAGLTRLIARVPNGRLGPVDIYVVVQPPARNAPVRGRPGGTTQQGYTAAVQLTSPARGGGWWIGRNAAALRQVNAGDFGWGYDAVLVPDGITKVRWTFQMDTASPSRTIRQYTVTATVHDNVAISRVPENAHGQVLVGASTVVWYTASGHVFGIRTRAS